MELLENQSLSNYCTYKTGGLARYLAKPSTEKELKIILEWYQQQKPQAENPYLEDLPLFILGQGSNLVFSDEGFPGLVVYLGKNWSEIQISGTTLRIQSGALLNAVVSQSVRQGLAGIQNLIGIPGTIGGGVFMNAGAFDQELGDVVREVRTMDYEGNIHTYSQEECKFAYRSSAFKPKSEIILEVKLDLSKSENADELYENMQAIARRRKEKQPLHLPNAGSMYKRPPGTFAGKLIEEAGLKGFRLGGAAISDHHANFVVNVDQACSQDIYDLSEEVLFQVEKNSGIRMEKEQIFVGAFKPWPRND